MFNPACENCSEEELDPFSSFPSEDLPPSLVAHWFPSLDVAKNLPQQSFGHMSSLRAHYVSIPKPEAEFLIIAFMLNPVL